MVLFERISALKIESSMWLGNPEDIEDIHHEICDTSVYSHCSLGTNTYLTHRIWHALAHPIPLPGRSGGPRQLLADLTAGQLLFLHHRTDPIRDLEENDCLSLLLNSPKQIYEDGWASGSSPYPATHETGCVSRYETNVDKQPTQSQTKGYVSRTWEINFNNGDYIWRLKDSPWPWGYWAPKHMLAGK